MCEIMETKPYKAIAARSPLQYWWQPFVMLFLVLLLCRLLPLSAILFKSRVVQPLPAAHVFYVNLDPDYAMEVLRASMQTWRRSNLADGETDGMSMGDVELSVPLIAPLFLKQGALYPGGWTPGVITPLAQSLPALLYVSAPEIRSDNSSVLKRKQSGVHSVYDLALQKAQFVFPVQRLNGMKGSGRARFYIETLQDGSVVHVLSLNSDQKEISAVERMLYLGRAEGEVAGEIEIWWSNP